MKDILMASYGKFPIALFGVLTAFGIANTAPAQAGHIRINFDTDEFGDPIVADDGIDVADSWRRLGVWLDANPALASSSDDATEHPLKVFDSNCGPAFGVACAGNDSNLAAGVGNVLIMNTTSSPPPDAWDLGGTFQFEFRSFPAVLDEITILDGGGVDEGDRFITAIFEDNTSFTLDLLAGQDNTLDTYDLSFLDPVIQLNVHLPGSGAIAELAFWESLDDVPDNSDDGDGSDGSDGAGDGSGGSDGSDGSDDMDFPDGSEDRPTSVPEPRSVLSLLGLGLAGIGSWMLKRNKIA